MTIDSIKIRTTATVSNVCCGFDCLGYAIPDPADNVTITKKETSGIEITLSGLKAESIPTNPEQNTAGKSILSLLESLKLDQGFNVHIEKGIHPGSGLGSSASSAVGAVFGANKLLDSPLKTEELMVHCMNGEIVSSGTVHADNVAPALLGGFILVRSYDPLDIIKLPVPKNLISINVLPDYIVNTREARELLPEQIPLSTAIMQSGNFSGFISGLYENNFELMGRSMVDLFAEPVRSNLIPGYESVHQSAMDNGAIGCGISGSGPSIFALSDSKEKAIAVGNGMVTAFQNVGLDSKLYIAPIHSFPPKILD
jgi:homoserine kinase